MRRSRNTEVQQRLSTAALNKLLKDKRIKMIKKEQNGFYCITYVNGAQFRARGPVVDNSSICTKE